jgi:hypothetical protein
MKGPYGSKEMVVEDGFLAGKGQLATLNLCSASNFKQLADHWNFNPQKSSKNHSTPELVPKSRPKAQQLSSSS